MRGFSIVVLTISEISWVDILIAPNTCICISCLVILCHYIFFPTVGFNFTLKIWPWSMHSKWIITHWIKNIYWAWQENILLIWLRYILGVHLLRVISEFTQSTNSELKIHLRSHVQQHSKSKISRQRNRSWVFVDMLVIMRSFVINVGSCSFLFDIYVLVAFLPWLNSRILSVIFSCCMRITEVNWRLVIRSSIFLLGIIWILRLVMVFILILVLLIRMLNIIGIWVVLRGLLVFI